MHNSLVPTGTPKPAGATPPPPRPEVPGERSVPDANRRTSGHGAARRALGGALVGSLLGATATLADLSAASATQAHKGPHAAAVALAHRELLAPSAYPARWEGQGASSGLTGAGFYVGLSPSDLQLMAACLGLSSSAVDASPVEAAGPYHSDPNSGLGASDTVEVYPNAGAAEADVEAAGSAQAPSCVERLQGADLVQGTIEGIGEGAQAAGSLAVTLRTVPGLPASAADEEIALPVSYQGVTGTTYSDYIYIDKGRSETVLEVDNLGAAPPAALVERLAMSAQARLTGN